MTLSKTSKDGSPKLNETNSPFGSRDLIRKTKKKFPLWMVRKDGITKGSLSHQISPFSPKMVRFGGKGERADQILFYF